MNATTRGIFVKQYLHGAAPETIAEIQELAGGLREYYKPAWKSSSSRKSSLRPPVTVALWHSNKSSNLSQGITLLVWFTASIAPRDIRRRQVARSTGQSKSSSEFRRHGRLARLLPAQRMGRRLRLLRSFFGSLTVCHHPQIAG